MVEHQKVSFFGWIEFLRTNTYVFLIFAFFIAILMVSNIRYPSFKKVQWNLKYFIMLLIALAFVIAQPSLALCVLLSAYIIYGVIRWIFIVLFRITMKKKDIEEIKGDNGTRKE